MTSFLLTYLIQNLVMIETYFLIVLLQKRLVKGSSDLNYFLLKIQLFFLTVPLLFIACGMVASWSKVTALDTTNMPDFTTFTKMSISYAEIEQILSSPIINNIVVLWCIITCALLLRYLSSLIHFKKEITDLPFADAEIERTVKEESTKMGIKRTIPVKMDPAVSTPMLTGILSPVILLPEQYANNSYNRYSICHELLHYKHKDNWLRFLAELYRCIFWINPFVFLLYKQVIQCYEEACDERVCNTLSDPQINEYCMLLVETAERNRKKPRPNKKSPSITLVERRKSSLEKRIIRVLNYKKSKSRDLITIALCVVMLLIMPVNIYAVSHGTKHLADQLFKDDTSDYYPLTNLGENAVFTLDTNQYDGYKVKQSVLQTRSQNPVNIVLGSLERTDDTIYLKKGTQVLVMLGGEPTNQPFRVRIGNYSVTSTNGVLHSSYTIPADGNYRISIINISSGDISIVGFISYN